MIRVTVEMVSGGVGEPVVIGRAILWNTGKGTRARGSYDGMFWRKKRSVWRNSHIENFPRQRLSVWHLLYQLLGEALSG